MSHNFVTRTYLKKDKPPVYKEREADTNKSNSSRQYKSYQPRRPLSIPNNFKLLGLGLGILALLWGFRPQLEQGIQGLSFPNIPTNLH